MIVTMDGPAGAGKSSIARMLAKRLGYDFLDTGAMYRCVTLRCLQLNIDLKDEQAIAQAADCMSIQFENDQVFVDGIEVTDRLRSNQVTQSIRPIADNLAVRNSMIRFQRHWAGTRDVVTEGRDQGTVAFPNAECKIFLTASPEERARRRVSQLLSIGETVDFQDVLAQQAQRDWEDTQRAVGGLKVASDAVIFETDGLSEGEVLERLVKLVHSRDRRRATGTQA
jgi:cytidylate kinase